jgi:hypothetical protein
MLKSFSAACLPSLANMQRLTIQIWKVTALPFVLWLAIAFVAGTINRIFLQLIANKTLTSLDEFAEILRNVGSGEFLLTMRYWDMAIRSIWAWGLVALILLMVKSRQSRNMLPIFAPLRVLLYLIVTPLLLTSALYFSMEIVFWKVTLSFLKLLIYFDLDHWRANNVEELKIFFINFHVFVAYYCIWRVGPFIVHLIATAKISFPLLWVRVPNATLKLLVLAVVLALSKLSLVQSAVSQAVTFSDDIVIPLIAYEFYIPKQFIQVIVDPLLIYVALIMLNILWCRMYLRIKNDPETCYAVSDKRILWFGFFKK